MIQTYYEILELRSTATTEDITKAFRKLAMHWHPDKNLDNVQVAEKNFKLIGGAYETATTN